MTAWSAVSLVLAMALVPGLALGFRLLGRPGGEPAAVGVQLAMFALSALLLWIVRRREGKSWESLGLGRPRLGETALLTLGGMVATVAVLAALIAALSALGIRSLEGDGSTYSTGLMALMCLRAGVVEELTYRGVAIDRMAALTGSATLGWLIPGVIFGLLHYPQGLSGILIATAAAGVMSALFLWKRNLWANMAIHFLIDFIPNVVLPAFGVGE
jgi:membrane protease YdiL (CAAX protease family)